MSNNLSLNSNKNNSLNKNFNRNNSNNYNRRNSGGSNKKTRGGPSFVRGSGALLELWAARSWPPAANGRNDDE